MTVEVEDVGVSGKSSPKDVKSDAFGQQKDDIDQALVARGPPPIHDGEEVVASR